MLVPQVRAARPLCRALLTLSSVFAAVCLASPPSCNASLRISDSAPHVDLFWSIYDHLPNCWKTNRAVVVQEVSDREMERLVARNNGDDAHETDDSEVDGCYQSEGEREDAPVTITLRESLRDEEAGMVFAHEYGHFIWDEKLTDAQRNRYSALWRAQRKAGNLVTDYAAETDEEGFAEAISFFLQRPNTLHRRDPKSERFLRDVLARSH